jgi:hypothetical protein
MTSTVVDIKIGETDPALVEFYDPWACLPVEAEDRGSG